MVKCVHLGTCTCKSPEAGTVSSRVVWNTRETSIGPARGTVELWNILVREWGRGEMFCAGWEGYVLMPFACGASGLFVCHLVSLNGLKLAGDQAALELQKSHMPRPPRIGIKVCILGSYEGVS